nr:hypothetical protein [Tanacetum cinerariifolium]
DDQQGQQRGPFESVTDQQAQQYAVVAVDAGLAFGFGVAATLCRQQTGHRAEQCAAEGGGRADQDRQQAKQTAHGIALQQHLTEAV